MVRTRTTRAFTLIELLVVIAIIGLLVSLLLPSLARAKDQARRAVCLSNLRSIGAAFHQYADEDERNMIFPLHGLMVRRAGYWGHRTAMWFVWGGRGAVEKFWVNPAADQGFWCNEDGPGNGWYGARSRPLTRYLFPDVGHENRDMPVFHCPGDRGYPDLPPWVIDDSPPGNAERPCYDTLGNSYRGSLAQLGTGGIGNPGKFSLGVLGQRADSFTSNASTVLWGGDPLFYNLIGSDGGGGGWGEVKRVGWHNEFMTDNQVYVDGSARITRAVGKDSEEWNPTDESAETWGIAPEYLNYVSRGPGYQIDAYPNPGVSFGPLASGFDRSSWPFRGYSTIILPTD